LKRCVQLIWLLVLSSMILFQLCIAVEPHHIVEPPPDGKDAYSINSILPSSNSEPVGVILGKNITITLLIFICLISHVFNKFFMEPRKNKTHWGHLVIFILCLIINMLIYIYSDFNNIIKFMLILGVFCCLPILFRYHLFAENLLLIVIKLIIKYEILVDFYIWLLYRLGFWGIVFNKMLNIGERAVICTSYLVLLLGFVMLIDKIIEFVSAKFNSSRNTIVMKYYNPYLTKYVNIIIFLVFVISTLFAEPDSILEEIMIRAGSLTLLELLQTLLIVFIFLKIIVTSLKIPNKRKPS